MSTAQETLIPTGMVPGLVTVEGKDGKRQNLWPIDAKELIASGEYKLVENGAVEAARMAATPLRSGMASGLNPNLIVSEISGIEGRIQAGADEDQAQELRDKADENADAVANDGSAPVVGATAHRESLAGLVGGTAGTETAQPEGKSAAKAPAPAPKPAESKDAADKK